MKLVRFAVKGRGVLLRTVWPVWAGEEWAPCCAEAPGDCTTGSCPSGDLQQTPPDLAVIIYGCSFETCELIYEGPNWPKKTSLEVLLRRPQKARWWVAEVFCGVIIRVELYEGREEGGKRLLTAVIFWSHSSLLFVFSHKLELVQSFELASCFSIYSCSLYVTN